MSQTINPVRADQHFGSIDVGDRIKDNDPRAVNRRLEITALQPHHVLAKRVSSDNEKWGQTYRIALSRIFIDDKERRTGYSKINLKGE